MINNEFVNPEQEPGSESFRKNEKLQQAKDTVGRMLRYAVANPDIALTDEIILNGVLALRKNTTDYSSDDEVLLWKVYAKLAILIKPASDISIQIADGLKDTGVCTNFGNLDAAAFLNSTVIPFSGFNSSGSKLVKRCIRDLNYITFFLIFFVGFYVFIQCYIALLSDTLTHSSQLLVNLETLQATERLIDAHTPNAQLKQLVTALEILDTQLSAASLALIDLTKSLEHIHFIDVSNMMLNTLENCAQNNATEQKKLLKCLAFEREYGSSIYAVLSRYVLPLLLGFVGATAYVTRHTLFLLATNSYMPSPRGMLAMRLCLGGLLGAISGIFISSGTNEASGFNISLTLAALVMGYSVEVAFSLFDSVIDRIKVWTKSMRSNQDANKPSVG